MRRFSCGHPFRSTVPVWVGPGGPPINPRQTTVATGDGLSRHRLERFLAGTVLLQRPFAGEFVAPAFAKWAELEEHGLDLQTGASPREDMSCRQVCSTPEGLNNCASGSTRMARSIRSPRT